MNPVKHSTNGGGSVRVAQTKTLKPTTSRYQQIVKGIGEVDCEEHPAVKRELAARDLFKRHGLVAIDPDALPPGSLELRWLVEQYAQRWGK